jgi:hypothetical protein
MHEVIKVNSVVEVQTAVMTTGRVPLNAIHCSVFCVTINNECHVMTNLSLTHTHARTHTHTHRKRDTYAATWALY